MNQGQPMRRKLFSAFLATLLAIAATFFVFYVIGFILTGTLGRDMGGLSKQVSNTIAKIFFALLFPCFFHVFYTQERNKIYSQNNIHTGESFNMKRELLRYLKDDSIPFLVVWGIFAVIQFILDTIYFFSGIRNPLLAVFVFVFPFQPDTITSWCDYLFSSCISPIISLLINVPLILLLALISRKMKHKKFKGK